MSMQGKVGGFSFAWKTPPRGPSGTAQLEVQGKLLEIRWRRDANGIWIELPHGVFGFDISGALDDEGRAVYELKRRGASGAWSGLRYEHAGEQSAATGAATGPKKAVRVRAQMPGKVISISVKPGDPVDKDQPLLTMEAMKMENIIRAPQAGKIGQVKVTAGQAIETGADLCTIDPI